MIKIQHGLCCYCEIDLVDGDQQIEHFHPQNDGSGPPDRAIALTNLLACCKGGAEAKLDHDPNRFERPVPNDLIDPRSLPALPSVIRVLMDGRLEVDTNACASTKLDPERVTNTITKLGLNVERLRRTREHHWKALAEIWGDIDDNATLEKAVEIELLPDGQGKLPPFFTTTRSFFIPFAESVLSEPPQSWI